MNKDPTLIARCHITWQTGEKKISMQLDLLKVRNERTQRASTRFFKS